MEIFENIFKELMSYRKILRVVLYLINEERYDDAKMVITRILKEDEIRKPINEVLVDSELPKV